MSHFMTFSAGEETLSEVYSYETVNTCTPKSNVTNSPSLSDLCLQDIAWD